MFLIEYEVIQNQFTEIECISDEEIQYNFLLGNITLSSSNAKIKIDWDWIPLLDLAFCLKNIGCNLKTNNAANDTFEFTENAETLDFFRQGKQLTITASFSPVILETTLIEFERGVTDFHYAISEYIRRNIPIAPPEVLKKYLS